MGYAFISYSTKNQNKADAIQELFRNSGINTWRAPDDIPLGSKYAQEINKAIKECACFVLLLTNEAQNSVWVAKEVERAINYHKTIITVQLEDVELNDEFEFYISNDHFVSINKIDENTPEVKKLLSSAAEFAESDYIVKTPEKTKQGVRKITLKSGIAVGIASGIIVVIAIIVFFILWFNAIINW